MSKHISFVQDCMGASQHTAGADKREHQLRHLPVLRGSVLQRAGILLLAASSLVNCQREQPPAAKPPAVEAVAAPSPAPSPPPAAAFDVAAVMKQAQRTFGVLPTVAEKDGHAATSELIALGRQLYFDPRLSKDHDLSCNSCHDLEGYGVDRRRPGAKTSSGYKGQLGARNSPTAYNAAMHVAQFWDGRASDVEEQAKGPILNPVEMALPDAKTVTKILSAVPGYRTMFAAAFPGQASPMTHDNVGIAIGAFERGLLTPGRFDDFLRGNASALSELEVHGLATFMDHSCSMCHAGPVLGGTMYQKLGLLKPYSTSDLGRYEITKNDADKGVFKVPALRNIAETSPYLHDGSQDTLTGVVSIMADYQTVKGKLSDPELNAIVTFLKSLTGDVPAEYIKAPALLPDGKRASKPRA